MQGKRGDASNAAWLLITITIIFVIYLILLPPGEREKLITAPDQVGAGPLPGALGGYGSGPSGQLGGYRTVLTMAPGFVSPVLQKVFSKPLGGVSLYMQEQNVQEALASSISLSSNFLNGGKQQFIFTSDEPGLVKASLLFFVKESKGNLKIVLNGQEIFDGPVFTEDLPIPLPKGLLRNKNTLVLEVEKPSVFQFYKSNFFDLKDIMILKSVVQANNQESRFFTLQKNEYQNLDSLTLYFVPNCGTANQHNRLAVALNGKIIDDREIVCDAAEVGMDLPPELLVEGRNVVDFAISGGTYTLEQVLVEGGVTQEKYPSTFFTLTREDSQFIVSGGHVILDVKMGIGVGRKIAGFVINGFPVYMDTFDDVFVEDITDLVTDGPNTFAVLPTTAFDLAVVNIFLR